MDMRALQFAHDLKMPIQLIYSCVQLLEMEISPNARAEGYLQMLIKSADELQSMVKGALDSPPGGDSVRLRVQDIVTQARSISRQCALLADEKGIRVHFETNAASFRMPTDGEKIRRILQNLTANALRFTPAGGHITVAVRVLGDGVEMCVSDTGCGIRPELQDRIFEPGVTEGGTGHGLAIVRRYARELGGDVCAESAPGRGSCFTIYLPVPGANALRA